MNHILASPLRKNYDQLKKSFDPNKCPFCNLDSTQVIKKGKTVAAILNIFPYTTSHLLIIPLKHKEQFEELTEEELNESMSFVKELIPIVKDEYKPDGFNVGINWGIGSGGSVKHFHIHLVPRFNNDAQFLHTTSNTTLIDETLVETRKRLTKHLQ